MVELLARPVHGGDVSAIARRHGIDPATLIDFSANVNPLGPPPAVLEALRAGAADVAALMRYPTDRERALREAAARAHGIDPACVVVANGAAALIEAFVRTAAPRRCVVPQPAFSEYGRALAAQGCEIVPLRLRAEANFALDVDELVDLLRRERPQACVLTNPHNPSGALASISAMESVVAQARTLGIALLIDEAFIDYVPEVSLLRSVLETDDALVIRSLTKFYAMPALRVGYAVASPTFAARVAGRVPRGR